MKTKITRSPSIAARYILHGDTVAFPTETVYGLGASIFDEAAIEKVFIAKGRPPDNPLIAHIADVSQFELLVEDVPPVAAKLIDAFFPGPLTLILPKRANISLLATAGLETIGVRMPHHAVARQFLRACGVPVVAPSANLSGRPSPTTWQAVGEDLRGRIGCILVDEPTRVGLESTVVDCTEDAPVILRAGAVTLEQLQEVVPKTLLAGPDHAARTRSPGTRHRHYSPQAKVVVAPFPQYTAPLGVSAYIGLEAPPQADSFKRLLICRDVAEYAHTLFQFFRDCDADGVETIFCQSVSFDGLGTALMDRIARAAQE